MNYKIDKDEVILYEGIAGYNKNYINHNIILTSKKIIIELKKGLFKKTKELINILELKDIKKYNDNYQVTQKSNEIKIQSVNENISLFMMSTIEAKKIQTKIMDLLTNTTIIDRSTKKIKDTINTIDDTLGVNSKEIVSNIITKGLKGTLINGITNKLNNKK